jgi:hypothetical protein
MENHLYQITRGAGESAVEILLGVIVSAILIGIGYALSDYKTYYFILASLFNIISISKLFDRYDHATLAYMAGWMLGMIILFFHFEIQFNVFEFFIYFFVPLLTILYKLIVLDRQFSSFY